MQFTLLSEEKCFCSFYPSSSGAAVGLQFYTNSKKNTMSKLKSIIGDISDPGLLIYGKSETFFFVMSFLDPKPEEIQSRKTSVQAARAKGQICVLNLVQTRKNTTVRRGAEVKALAIATPLQFLESFKVCSKRASHFLFYD